MSQIQEFQPASTTRPRPGLHVVLAGPRGFCAGVDRAIRVVEEAIRRYGAPVYVRHEIVHNRTVVEALEAQGAVFVEELDEVPADAHVVFSAHGVPKSVPAEAQRRNLSYLDATCPLVSKVHREAERHYAGGGPNMRHILMIGHAGHPEVVGTMGQLPPGSVTLVQDTAGAEAVMPTSPDWLAFITQTTLSVDDTAEIVATLRRRFPAIEGPKHEDICYATTNRQAAVKAIAPQCDLVVVIGSPNSSNSQRLREVAERAGDARPGGVLHGVGGGHDVGGVGAGEAGDHRAILGEAPGDGLHAVEIAGAGDGEAGLDDIDAELVQCIGHAQLLVEVHREAGRLLAVAQRGVEEDDPVVGQGAEAGVGDGHWGVFRGLLASTCGILAAGAIP